MNTWPEIDHWFVWSLAQSALVYPMSPDSPMVYMMLQLGQLERYCMMCLTLLMWSGPNVAVNGESDLTAVQISG